MFGKNSFSLLSVEDKNTIKNKWLRYVLFLASSLFLAYLSGGAAFANGKKPIPKPLTMEEKVKGSDLILVGEVTRVYFTDYERKELMKDPENSLDTSTWLRVRVKKTLYNKESQVEEEMTIYYPNDGSLGPTLRNRYMGKDWIFFIRLQRTRKWMDGQLIQTVTPAFTPGRWLVYPHAMNELSQVVKVVDEMRSAQTAGPQAK